MSELSLGVSIPSSDGDCPSFVVVVVFEAPWTAGKGRRAVMVPMAST